MNAPQPDVTVIVAVYNTLPYLSGCLQSIAEQTIGHDRMQVVAVDDGSTDGSGKELDRFAGIHPGEVVVVHQPNSGGPAAPSNRALDLATGRYVYFVGADDRLGPEALERLVAMADEHDSDVVVGKMVGVNGRYVAQGVFRQDRTDVSLADLVWSLSNVKLFRRELVERHALRFPEDMATCSDQPFTIAACSLARRISVLAGYTCYYAHRRDDGSNVTYGTAPLKSLDSAERLIAFTSGHLEPGPVRDALLRRHFSWEVGKVLDARFLALDESAQRQICTRIGRLVDQHLSAGIRRQITAPRRLRLCLAQRGAVTELCELLRQEAAGVSAPLVLTGDAVHERRPGFGDRRLNLPIDCFEVPGRLLDRLTPGVSIGSFSWRRDRSARRGLVMEVRVALTGAQTVLDDAVGIGLLTLPKAGEAPPARRTRTAGPRQVEAGEVRRRRVESPPSVTVQARVPSTALVGKALEGRRLHAVRLRVTVGATAYDLPVRSAKALTARCWHRARPYDVRIRNRGAGALITVTGVRRSTAILDSLRAAWPSRRGTS